MNQERIKPIRILILFVLIITIIFSLINVIRLENQLVEVNENYSADQEEWENSSKSYEESLSKLNEENGNLSEQISKQESKIANYEDKISEKESEIDELKKENEKLNSSLKSKSNATPSKSTNNKTLNGDTGFRSWMPYTAISKSSTQWKTVSQGSPNEYGILEIDGRAVVAVGTGWGLSLGDKATVYTTNGSYKIIVGDWKAKGDTDSSNKVTTSNGCVVEFIVDRSCLDSRIRSSGNVASISKYSGKVTDIVKD